MKRNKPPTERFWSQVRIENGSCWEWIGAKDTHGYGHMSINNRTHRVHRVSYKIFHSEIPNKLHVLHKCDNRNCVNPDHLFLGTNDDNVQDSVTKGRRRGAIGEKNCNSKFVVSDIREIRELHKANSYTPTELASLYSVATSTIHRIVTRKTWSHID